MKGEQQKKLGAFYTPEQVTDCLSSWAIRQSSDKILEPSFGGCNFLTSSIKMLSGLGTKKPCSNIFGFDVDPTAFDILQKKDLDGPNFIFEDFLASSREDSIQVNVILGNPPYLPIHRLEEAYKLKLFQQFQKSDFKIPRRSSLWIYFIVHSFKYLSVGGRMAWVVPDSIAFTHYGKTFLSQLSTYFTSVSIVRIEERYFTEVGTKEKTSFLLCDGFRLGSSTIEELKFDFLYDALTAVSNILNKPKALRPLEGKRTKAESTVFGRNFELQTFGDLFYVKIGIVIGATDLLVFNRQDAEKTAFYPEYTYPIVTKGKQLNGLSINREKLCSKEANTPIYLVNGIKLESTDPVTFAELLRRIPDKVLLNETFRKRSKLFGYDDYQHPDAFLSFYTQNLPKFVVNQNKELNCTNSVHRLYLKSDYSQGILKFIAIQNFGGFFADDIRRLARLYGDTIHKFEPSDARKIPVIIPVSIQSELEKMINDCADLIENKLEIGDIISAKNIALNFIQDIIS